MIISEMLIFFWFLQCFVGFVNHAISSLIICSAKTSGSRIVLDGLPNRVFGYRFSLRINEKIRLKKVYELL